jgi:hypothetical protein
LIESRTLDECVGLFASSEINFGFVRDLALYAFGFAAEIATLYS